MEAFEPTLEETVRALTEETARRIRTGESRASVRASLIADGLPIEFVDGFLAGIAEPTRWPVGRAVGVTLSAAALMVLPVAGAVGGMWLTWAPLTDEHCGMWVFPALLIAACGALVGLTIGIGLALAFVWGLSSLADVLSRDV
jgi:hypothetical protein